MNANRDSGLDAQIANEVQIILAEKRTALSALRTGIAIFAFPLTVLSALVATSKAYRATDVLHLLIPLGILNLALVVLAVYLVVRAIRRLHHYDRILRELKRKHSVLAEFVD